MNSNHKGILPIRQIGILAGAALVSVGIYLLYSSAYFRIGFPLDDAWIHQTYARNLALLGEWSFFPGQISGGSTAPLWSTILAAGYKLGLGPYIWTYFFNILALWGLATLSESIVRFLITTYRPRIPWVGIMFALEWHLVWSAASGMETLLYAILVTASLGYLIFGFKNTLILGLLIGLSIWVRPDGVSLLIPAILMKLISGESWKKRFYGLLNLGIGSGILGALYLLFNLIVSGSPFPNTFYAKQAEYASYARAPFIYRLGSESLQLLIGVGIAVLPSLIILIISAFRKKNWGIISAALWIVVFLGIYAWRLPVTYQHGRYVIPVLPIFLILGMAGLVEYCMRWHSRKRIITLFWKLVTGSIVLLFWGRGMYAYAQDVAVIESEMVDTARWVSNHVPPDALIAAHDIGALGYFGGHKLVDLAGLISPEVIPFLHDEEKIASYLNESGVDYLITFPDWYPILTLNLEQEFITNAPYAPAFGEKNMVVFKWPGE
jgi:hypothetical protein